MNTLTPTNGGSVENAVPEPGPLPVLPTTEWVWSPEVVAVWPAIVWVWAPSSSMSV